MNRPTLGGGLGSGRECLLCKQALSLVMVEKKVPHGQKMIEVRLRFWTNAIAKKKDHIVPKHCWDHGTLYIVENEGHEVKHRWKAFRSLTEVSRVIEKLLQEDGITIHHGRYTRGVYE